MMPINKIMKWLRNRIELLKNDNELCVIFFMHLLLIGLHVYENFVGSIEYHWYLRASGCGLISLFIFLFGRAGLAYGLVVYSCSLIYINNFYNYASIFFMLIAIGANPRIKKAAQWLYLINVVISFTMKRLGIIPFLIHIVYMFMFYVKIKYVFSVNKPSKLNLTDDERKILDELLDGKMQKEIDLFSPQTITAKIKNARERNMCDSTPELLTMYSAEIGTKLKIGKCGKPCKTNCPKRDECCVNTPPT